MEIAKYKEQVTSSFSDFLPKAKISSIEALTPDASARRYFRVMLQEPITINKLVVNSVIAMLFLSTKSPESGGSNAITADYAVLELGKFLSQHGLAVPNIFFDNLARGLIFTEDLGDISLADNFKTSKNINHYKNAITQLKLLQTIENDNSFFAFKREFGFQQYRVELNEILDFYLTLSKSERYEMESELNLLANRLSKFDKVLTHRDFHSWNLMVDSKNHLRVIDYQDALMATKYYDLVALLNDRDTDGILGEDVYLELLRFYSQVFNKPQDFLTNFSLVALQRDLKVVGRFAKLDRNIAGANYSKWIPGTMRRIARTLNFLNSDFNNLHNILAQKQPEHFSGKILIDLRKLNE